jgi:PhnB protein
LLIVKDIVTFLAFDGNCREAMEFYKKCFGAELFLLPYADAPGDLPLQAKAAKDRILHATLSNGVPILMGADILPGTPFLHGNNFSVMLHCESLEEIERLFTALGENGEVTMALQDTFWGARFGTLTDQFGIRWSFNLPLGK